MKRWIICKVRKMRYNKLLEWYYGAVKGNEKVGPSASNFVYILIVQLVG